MALTTGTRLGPYEIISSVGAGGMGEVYRARDARLERDVAIKVLPAALAADAERLRRFEQEARAAARLNHPGILHVYDVGQYEGQPYLVTELLEGCTLRERMAATALPVRKAVELGIAIAYGLAAAHEQGIVHRDLKPENLFVTADGRVKILDFGLAKLMQRDDSDSGRTSAHTMGVDTAAGVVLGTVSYMSPEQVRGQKVDHRSDLFSFGAILYEMLAGTRAFRGESPADTMSAILREDPPDLTSANKEIPLVLERIVLHCLEKSAGERFRSAHDLAFQLEAISGLSGAGLEAVVGRAGSAPGATTPVRPVASFRLLAYRLGFVHSARFAPDGETVVYSAAWEGEPVRTYMKRKESPEPIPLALPGTAVRSISSTGEIALVLNPRWAHNGVWRGTLAVAPLFGGAPREIEEDIHDADFAPTGEMVVARDFRGKGRLEFPIGQTLYENAGHVSFPRVSPAGDRVAFLDHPFGADDRGAVAVVDWEGRKTTLTRVWSSVQGLAWSPSGEEIWFTAADSGSSRSLYAVTPSGDLRFISGFPGPVRIFDIAADGRVLLARDSMRVGVRCKAPGEATERELSWLDWTLCSDLTPDGSTLLLNEHSEGGGANYLVCVRHADGTPVVQLGEGRAMAISPDGRWALAILPTPGSPITLLPTGPGRKRTIAAQGVDIQIARWLPDGGRVLCVGRTAEQAYCAYLLHLNREIMERLPLERSDPANGAAVAGDGRTAAVSFPDGTCVLLPLDGGRSRPGPILEAGDRAVAFSADGEWLFVEEAVSLPRGVARVQVRSGERQSWKSLLPADSSGVILVFGVRIVADGQAYSYGYGRVLSDLYLVSGLD